jgi:predicted HTH transcriptional regulator
MRPESVRAGGHPRSRNELVANFLQTRRLMEQRGRGWPIMRRAMMDHNGTEPELLEDRSSPFVRVTLAIRPPG